MTRIREEEEDHLVLCFIILPCLFNPAFHAAILNKPLID